MALLQDRFRPARLVGTDYDPAQVAFAGAALARRWGGLPPSVEVRVADATALPFPDASFDRVFAMMMLHHVEVHHGEYSRRPEALREIRRVLAPGGLFVYSEILRRADVRRTLSELGFTPKLLRTGWRKDVGVYLRPA